MAWYDYVPGVSEFSQGNIGQGLLDVGTLGLYDDAKGDVKGAYDKKAQGYDAVIAQAAANKADRIKRQQDTYDLADSKLAPSRAALAAVYGDPSTWKL